MRPGRQPAGGDDPRGKETATTMSAFGLLELLLVLLSVVLFVILIGGAIAALVWFSRRSSAGPAAGGGEDEALRILRERYARGELTREEYERMRDELRD